MIAGTFYAIRVAGHLDRRWWGWFAGCTVTIEPSGETVLVADIGDHRQLLGVLVTLHELGHDLISIVRKRDRGVGAQPLVSQA